MDDGVTPAPPEKMPYVKASAPGTARRRMAAGPSPETLRSGVPGGDGEGEGEGDGEEDEEDVDERAAAAAVGTA